MSPPSVEEETEEEWIDRSGIKVVSMDIENSVSFHRGAGPPQSTVGRKIASLGYQPWVISDVPGMFLGT